jgi:antibiotic biosynthesis monooxygenase (ABM) superfamily enzyme
MSWIKRNWTPEEADEWTKEDLIAVILAPFTYIFLSIGLALSLFELWSGYILLGAGVIVTGLMFWVIHPKLNTISRDYETKQKQYLEELERSVRWEETK